MFAPIERKERSTGWWLVIGLLIFCPSISYAADLRAVLITAIVCFGAWHLAYCRTPVPPAGLMPRTTPVSGRGTASARPARRA